MVYKNGIIHTVAFYQVIDQTLEALGIEKNESDLMNISFFFDHLSAWNEEDDGTGILLSNGNRFVIPYKFNDFGAFVEEILRISYNEANLEN